MEQTTEYMRIGELAESVRLNPKTIRYYEQYHRQNSDVNGLL